MNYNQEEAIEQEEDALSGKYLIFKIADEEYGIEIRFVKEIIGMQPINTLPEVPVFIKGVINLRGKIIPLVDMRLRIGKSETEYTERTCIVVVETAQLTAGLIVDQVAEVIAIDESNIVPPPDVQKKGSRGYISGIGKVGETVKLLVDSEKLFNGEETKSMIKIGGEN